METIKRHVATCVIMACVLIGGGLLSAQRCEGVTILHRDGAIWSSDSGWVLTTPPYYPGTSYAMDIAYRADGTYGILHTDGAIWDSSRGWLMDAPPYYPGTAYAQALVLKPGTATSIIVEAFDGATFPPAGWTIVNNGGDCVWQTNTALGKGNSTGGSGACALADADACGENTFMDTGFLTPQFALPNATLATLSFLIDFKRWSGNEYADIDISIDGGTTWETVARVAAADRKGPFTADLTPYCKGSAIIIGFHYANANDDWWLAIDDVRIEGKTADFTVLHRDGALWNETDGWVLGTPPYYPGTDYARGLRYRADGSYLILHRDGAIYDSVTGWIATAPPYYPGTAYVRDIEITSDGFNYAILHRDGAIWFSDTGWVLTAPPYYPGTAYAIDLGCKGDESSYLILHKDGAVYDSFAGWILETPPYYPASNWAVAIELR